MPVLEAHLTNSDSTIPCAGFEEQEAGVSLLDDEGEPIGYVSHDVVSAITPRGALDGTRNAGSTAPADASSSDGGDGDDADDASDEADADTDESSESSAAPSLSPDPGEE